ncbi:MAG: RNA polymerase sigma factor [Verrucomicrobiota bacterium]|jgi:RNA polymerase sigma-70 factor (ECF subfamily)
MIEEALLVWKLKRGDPDALRQVYLKHKDRLFALAVSLCRDPAQAEDALHDVFVTLATSAGTLKLRTDLRAYLSTCVVNRLRNQWRRSHRQVDESQLAEWPDECSVRPDQAAMVAEDAEQIGQALKRLPYEQCEVIIMHLQSGLTFQAIATGLDVSISTVQSRYRYGLEKLRNLLKGELKNETRGSN